LLKEAWEIGPQIPQFALEYATILEGEATLSGLWFAVHERKLATEEGIPVDDDLRKRVRRDFPPPSAWPETACRSYVQA